MSGFVRRSWGNKPNTPATSTADQQWNVTVKFAQYTKNGNLMFKLGGFKYGDEFKLNKLNPGVFFIKKSDQSNAMYLYVKTDKVEEFQNMLPDIQNELKNCSNHYTDASITKFAEVIEDFIEKTPTEEELSANTAAIITNWKELLEKLNDPETKKRFLAFQTTYICKNSYKDAVLSPRNVMEVRLADPQASFVTDAPTWKKLFNRIVTPGSPFVIITKSENTIPSDNLMNTDPYVQREGGWKAFKAKRNYDMSNGEIWSAVKRVKKANNLPTTYFKSKVYDVRFTKPIDPNDDKFLKVANLINNLTGELNDVAKEIMRNEAMRNGEETPDFDAKKEGFQTSEELEKYKEFILKKCKAKKLNIQEIGSTEDIIANAIYTYAYNIAESYNVLSPRARAAFASAVLYSVANTIGLNSSQVSQSVNIFDKLSKDEGEDLAQKTFEVYKSLAGTTLDESVGHLMSYEQYHDMIMKLLPSKENVKKKFDEFNDRMNNL